MYDSREIIVIELQQWLAKRLLVAHDYDIDAEVSKVFFLALNRTDIALLCEDHGDRKAEVAIWRRCPTCL